MKFRVPHETPAPTLEELLRRAWPEAGTATLAAALANDEVWVDMRAQRHGGRVPPADALIEVKRVAGAPDEPVYGDARELVRGPDWVVLDKTIGMVGSADANDPMSPVAFLADELGFDRSAFTPVWACPPSFGGPWPCAADAAAAGSFADDVSDGGLITTWVALVPQSGLPAGRFEHAGMVVDYATSRQEGGLSELQLTPRVASRRQSGSLVEVLLDALSERGTPVLGDRERSGYMVDGGLRLRLLALYDLTGNIAESWTPPRDWWPDCPVVPQRAPQKPGQKPGQIPVFHVSAKTLEVLAGGHPWILPDRESDDAAEFEPGQLVRLRTRDGASGPYALIDGAQSIAARVWSDYDDEATSLEEEAGIRFDEAVARRAPLVRDSARTNLFRLVHGEADRLPGFFLDRIGPLYRATLTGNSARAYRERIYDGIAAWEPGAMILEVEHLQDVRRTELPSARIIAHGDHYLRPGDRVIAHEDGLSYWCEPWEGIDVGFFADQRDNRRELAQHAAPGQKWLNLFCHTGAFTVALAAQGAQVVSVDISRRYLDWLEENLALNELDPALNISRAEDAREYVRGTTERFHGVIIDPPTAAQSNAGFWSVKADYEALIAACAALIEPGGHMLVCRNSRHRRPPLPELVEGGLRTAGRHASGIRDAKPSADYPRVREFPEGDPFEAVHVELRQ